MTSSGHRRPATPKGRQTSETVPDHTGGQIVRLAPDTDHQQVKKRGWGRSPIPTVRQRSSHLLKKATMTPEQFKDWRTRLGLSQTAAAEALGLSRQSIENYERGRRREDERPVVIPKAVALACAAVWHRLEPWGT